MKTGGGLNVAVEAHLQQQNVHGQICKMGSRLKTADKVICSNSMFMDKNSGCMMIGSALKTADKVICNNSMFMDKNSGCMKMGSGLKTANKVICNNSMFTAKNSVA